MRMVSFMLLLSLPGIAFLTHGILNRLRRFRSEAHTKLALVSITLSSILVSVSILALEHQNPSLITIALFTFFACPLLGHIYFQVFNLSETARRIKLLVTLKKTGSFSLNGSYDPSHLVSLRLKRLQDLNQISLKDGTYTPRLTSLTLAALTLRSLERFVYPYRHRKTS